MLSLYLIWFLQGTGLPQEQEDIDLCLPIAASIEASMARYSSGTALYSVRFTTHGKTDESKVKVQFINQMYCWFDEAGARSGYVSADAECVAQYCKGTVRLDRGEGDTKAHLYALAKNNAPAYLMCHPRYFMHGIALNFIDTGFKRPTIATVIRTLKASSNHHNIGHIKLVQSNATAYEIHFLPSHGCERYEYLIDKTTGIVMRELCIAKNCKEPVEEITRVLGKLPNIEEAVPVKVTIISRTLGPGPNDDRPVSNETKYVIELTALRLDNELKENNVDLEFLEFPRGGVVNDHRSGKEYLYNVPEVNDMLIDDALQEFRKTNNKRHSLFWSYAGGSLLFVAVMIWVLFRNHFFSLIKR